MNPVTLHRSHGPSDRLWSCGLVVYVVEPYVYVLQLKK